MATFDLARMVYVSPAYERVWGQSCESLYRDPRSFLEPILPEDLPRVMNDMNEKKDGVSFDHEYRIRRPDGSIRWIWDRGWPVRGDNGEIVHYVGVAQDITERKLAEIELAALAERFRLVSRATNDGVWDWDMVTNEAWWSDSYYTTFGYDRGTKPCYEAWADCIHPDDRASVLASFAEAIESHEPGWTAEYRFLMPDGSVKDVFDRSYVLHDASGKSVRMVGALMDVTERKRAEIALRESEARFRATFEQAAVGVAHVALDGRFLRVNQKLCDITGYGRDELASRHFGHITYPEDAAADQRVMERLLRGEIQTHTGQKRLLRKDGSPVFIEVTSSLVHTPSGAPDYFMGVVVDISERRSIEGQLRHAQKMEAMGVLAGGVAHDFNNMLQAIILDAELAMLTPDLPSAVDRGLANVKTVAERAATLARQLLLFSRREVMQRQNLEINVAVTNFGTMLERILGEDIRLELRLSPDAGGVHADPGMIDQVLMNLAVNARDAMPRGGALTIETSLVKLDEGDARLRKADATRAYVRISVCDTGCGIAPDVIPRIFEPFFTTKEPGRGTGLGLATVFGVVEQHSGWTDVESEVWRGTTFHVFLPALAPDRRRRLTLTRASARAGGETILLVEDDAIVRSSVRAILAHYGYSVVEATTGPEALLRWDELEGKVDLVLTDIVMPGGMDGRELAAQLVAKRPGLCVVYASGYSRDLAGRDLPLRRNERFVSKPLTADRLLDTLRTCLEA
jgi:two-component system cell cycle sensor histidine kinase/response regulator CckA